VSRPEPSWAEVRAPLAPSHLTPEVLADLFARVTVHDLAKTIDHSLLRPELDDAFVEAGCRLAAEYDVASVCVRPADVRRAVAILAGTDVAVETADVVLMRSDPADVGRAADRHADQRRTTDVRVEHRREVEFEIGIPVQDEDVARVYLLAGEAHGATGTQRLALHRAAGRGALRGEVRADALRA